MQAKFRQGNLEYTFSDADIVNVDDWIPKGESNPHNVRPFLFCDHGFPCGVVFADCLQDALDALADSGKIDGMQIAESEMPDYPNEEGITYLGNASEPFDIESIQAIELPNPPRSFCAQFAAHFQG